VLQDCLASIIRVMIRTWNNHHMACRL
jgi:hypothetical protein